MGRAAVPSGASTGTEARGALEMWARHYWVKVFYKGVTNVKLIRLQENYRDSDLTKFNCQNA